MKRRGAAPLAALVVAIAALGANSAVPRAALALTLIATNDTYSVVHDRTLSVAAPGVLGNDIGLLGSSTAVGDSLPAHGTLTLRTNGSFTYVPNAGYVGTDSFRYHAHDVVLLLPVNSLPATVTITITNAAPVAANDAYAATTGVQLNVAAPGVLRNDSDADGDTLTAAVVSKGGNGSLSLSGNGSFTYTSGGSFVGTYSFTYQVSDGVASSNVATATITVSSPPATPTPVPTPTLPSPTLPLPTPSLPLLTPTPSATASPTPGSSLGPSASPTGSAGPSPTAPAAPQASDSGTPGGGSPGPGGGSSGPGGGSDGPFGIGAVDLGPTFGLVDAGFGGFDGIDWAVPALALTVPGLLLILAILAQTVVGAVWLPFVRRWLGAFGVRRRKAEAKDAA